MASASRPEKDEISRALTLCINNEGTDFLISVMKNHTFFPTTGNSKEDKSTHKKFVAKVVNACKTHYYNPTAAECTKAFYLVDQNMQFRVSADETIDKTVHGNQQILQRYQADARKLRTLWTAYTRLRSLRGSSKGAPDDSSAVSPGAVSPRVVSLPVKDTAGDDLYDSYSDSEYSYESYSYSESSAAEPALEADEAPVVELPPLVYSEEIASLVFDQTPLDAAVQLKGGVQDGDDCASDEVYGEEVIKKRPAAQTVQKRPAAQTVATTPVKKAKVHEAIATQKVKKQRWEPSRRQRS